MANQRFRCRECGKLKQRRTPDQRYCGDADCQKARKNAWRSERYGTDPDYRLNQRESTNAWLEANGGAAEYYRRYRRARKQRRSEPDSSTGEAKPAAVSASTPRTMAVANSDASLPEDLTISGVYEFVPLDGANSDGFRAEIRVISIC